MSCSNFKQSPSLWSPRLTLWRDSSFRCSSRADTLTAPARVLDPGLRALAEFAAPPGEFLELIEGESIMRAPARL